MGASYVPQPIGPSVVAKLREEERWTYRVLQLAMVELTDQPVEDEVGLARMRQRYANARDNWAAALRTLDALTQQTGAH